MNTNRARFSQKSEVVLWLKVRTNTSPEIVMLKRPIVEMIMSLITYSKDFETRTWINTYSKLLHLIKKKNCM